MSLSNARYAELFYEVFREAVRCRTRSRGPIAVDLSGGLDSSSVVGLLAQLRADGVLEQEFEAYSLAFPGLACDETRYARAVAERWACPWSPIPVEPAPTVDYVALARESLDFPGYPNGLIGLKSRVRAHEQGVRVWLTGIGGDEWLSGAPGFARFLDSVRARSPLSLTRATLVDPRSAIASARFLAGTHLRGARWARSSRQLRLKHIPPWIDRGFARRIDLVDRMVAASSEERDWNWSRRTRLARGLSAWSLHAMEMEVRMYSSLHLEARHPFLDRRLVELAVALPEQQCSRDGVHKAILRDAMVGTLPEAVLARTDKAEFSHLFRNELRSAAVRHVLEAPWADERPDWVLKEPLRRELQGFLTGEAKGNEWPLWMLYGIKTWHRVLVEATS